MIKLVSEDKEKVGKRRIKFYCLPGLLFHVQLHNSLWVDFDRFTPKLQFWINPAVEVEGGRVGLKGGNWWVVGHLFAN